MRPGRKPGRGSRFRECRDWNQSWECRDWDEPLGALGLRSDPGSAGIGISSQQCRGWDRLPGAPGLGSAPGGCRCAGTDPALSRALISPGSVKAPNAAPAPLTPPGPFIRCPCPLCHSHLILIGSERPGQLQGCPLPPAPMGVPGCPRGDGGIVPRPGQLQGFHP